jgi:hypothetical protein
LREDIHISRDGIRIPYRRLLSDSAAGVVFFLLLVVSYRFPLFTREAIHQTLTALSPGSLDLGREVKVFLLIAAVLLATPVGFAINAVSWALLGQVISEVERVCAERNLHGTTLMFPAWDCAGSRCVPDLAARFGIQSDFPQATSLLREVLETPVLAEWEPGSEVRGLVILLRNGALFLLFGGALALYSAQSTLFPRGVCAVVAFVLALCLTRRWPSPMEKSERILRAAMSIVIIGGCGYLSFEAGDPDLVGRSMALVAGASMTALLAGIVGYYNSCDAVLHAHFAAASIGIPLQNSGAADGPERKTLQIVTEMAVRAAELSRAQQLADLGSDAVKS